MAQPDYLNVFSEFWKAGERSFPAEQMKVFAQGLTSGFGLAPEMLGSINPHLAEAGTKFRELVDTCVKLPGEMVPGNASSMPDAITAELLQKILDPREWLQATGLVDDTVRKLTEAPKLADLWQVEGKYLALMRAWTEARAFSVEHGTHVLSAWAKAATEFTAKLKENVKENVQLSRRDIVNQWVEVANRHLIEVQGSAPYLETQRKLLRASTDLRIAQRELNDHFSDLLGLPTRAEFDDVTRMVSELRREMRANQRSSG